jgi:hypothetical protein
MAFWRRKRLYHYYKWEMDLSELPPCGNDFLAMTNGPKEHLRVKCTHGHGLYYSNPEVTTRTGRTIAEIKLGNRLHLLPCSTQV